MKQVLLVLALVFSAYISFAQQAPAADDPCHQPILELYDDNRRKLPEGAMPRGKATLIVRNNPACDKPQIFSVKSARYYHVRGAIPLNTVTFSGPTTDFTGLAKVYKPGDRLLFEVLEIICYNKKGEETGKFPGGVVKSWPLNR
ncbi:hypothetical protein [Pontibacter cellulosilyticus]|uniref:Uncharacterized protein n=1 Tax=Pontibacter cellulosilyticus TaxID=1720253 RepID=A0A923SIP1_9BACT|nr:hypothetical protein [Pontibacter cellulosilyticus]MBC5991871.1 hypothetical protein [Pontibacter cellulosilyticus]